MIKVVFCLRHRACRHDIVRDFTLASQGDSGLGQLQRSFIATLVSPGLVSAPSTVRSFASSSLMHHLRGALSPPFANDDLASTLLLHETQSVVSQGLNIILFGTLFLFASFAER